MQSRGLMKRIYFCAAGFGLLNAISMIRVFLDTEAFLRTMNLFYRMGPSAARFYAEYYPDIETPVWYFRLFEINALYINFPIYHIYKAVLGKSPEFPVLLPYTLDFIILSSLMWAMGGALICLITAPLAPKIKNSYRKRKEIFIGALALGLIGTLAAILSSKGLGTDSSFVFFLTLIPLFFLEIASRLFPFFRAEGLILTGPVFIFFNGMIWVAIGAFVGYLLHLFKKDYFFHFIVI